MKLLHLLTILFYLTVAANIALAQAPRGIISGNVSDDNGPVAYAKISVKLNDSTDYNRIQTTFTNKDGSFIISMGAGVYIVTTEFTCLSSRIVNVEVPPDKTTILNVKLINEDCAKKTAAEEFEWKSCEQEASVTGLQIINSDKAEIINQILEELFKFEDGFIGDNYRGTIFSTDNIDSAWIKPFPNLNVTFLSPQELQARADKEGGFGYLSFSTWRPGNNCAFIGISMQTAVSKKQAKNKDSEMFFCPVGNSKIYLFHKDADKWKMKQSKRF